MNEKGEKEMERMMRMETDTEDDGELTQERGMVGEGENEDGDDGLGLPIETKWLDGGEVDEEGKEELEGKEKKKKKKSEWRHSNADDVFWGSSNHGFPKKWHSILNKLWNQERDAHEIQKWTLPQSLGSVLFLGPRSIDKQSVLHSLFSNPSHFLILDNDAQKEIENGVDPSDFVPLFHPIRYTYCRVSPQLSIHRTELQLNNYDTLSSPGASPSIKSSSFSPLSSPSRRPTQIKKTTNSSSSPSSSFNFASGNQSTIMHDMKVSDWPLLHLWCLDDEENFESFLPSILSADPSLPLIILCFLSATEPFEIMEPVLQHLIQLLYSHCLVRPRQSRSDLREGCSLLDNMTVDGDDQLHSTGSQQNQHRAREAHDLESKFNNGWDLHEKKEGKEGEASAAANVRKMNGKNATESESDKQEFEKGIPYPFASLNVSLVLIIPSLSSPTNSTLVLASGSEQKKSWELENRHLKEIDVSLAMDDQNKSENLPNPKLPVQVIPEHDVSKHILYRQDESEHALSGDRELTNINDSKLNIDGQDTIHNDVEKNDRTESSVYCDRIDHIRKISEFCQTHKLGLLCSMDLSSENEIGYLQSQVYKALHLDCTYVSQKFHSDFFNFSLPIHEASQTPQVHNLRDQNQNDTQIEDHVLREAMKLQMEKGKGIEISFPIEKERIGNDIGTGVTSAKGDNNVDVDTANDNEDFDGDVDDDDEKFLRSHKKVLDDHIQKAVLRFERQKEADRKREMEKLPNKVSSLALPNHQFNVISFKEKRDMLKQRNKTATHY